MAESFDVIISGAGPAGAACALALKNSGLRIGIFDKAAFPRDKICGDFVAAKGIRELVSIQPDLKERFAKLPQKVINKSTQLFVGNLKPLQLDWVLKSYTIKREIFDNELLREVLKSKNIDFYPKNGISKIIKKEDFIELKTAQNQTFQTKIIIGADGAHSPVAKQLAGFKIDREHYGGSVRGYFSNVENIDTSINEVYVHKDVIPGYFWLFPISKTEANVGLGMHSWHITKDKINLKEVFCDFIAKNPILKSKLKNAKMNGKLEGFGLPFYSKKQTVSGHRFLLCGDAASLIDPTNGEGILPAISSGKMAAEHILDCFENQRFDAEFNQKYAGRLHGKYWKEMRMKSWLVKHFADKPKLLNAVAWACVKSPFLKRRLQKML